MPVFIDFLLPALLSDSLAIDDSAPFLMIAAAILFMASTMLPGVVGGAARGRVKADKVFDVDGHPTAFTLTLELELIRLEPGKPWIQMDHYKWVTRGLIEEPQSFHVHQDGMVEINGEKIRLDDPFAIDKLEHEINKQHSLAGPKSSAPVQASPRPAAEPPETGKVQFKVKLDHLGHLMIRCQRGTDHSETGLRGIPGLIQNGLMLKPGSFHIDPLQHGIELDGARFECNEKGARELEEALNSRYAADWKASQLDEIEIKENVASPTGFDIRFVNLRGGVRYETKGHLTQESLDILQDAARSSLLRPGIVLKLAPPHFLIRRRRPDGGEESIPELPDVYYIHVTAQQLQQVLNHPLVRKTAGGQSGAAVVSEIPGPTSISAPVSAAPQIPPAVPAPSKPAAPISPGARDDTAPPRPEQQAPPSAPSAPPGAPLSGKLDVPTATRSPTSSGTSMPPVAVTPSREASRAEPASATGTSERREPAPATTPTEPAVDSEIQALFTESDPLRVNAEIFQRLRTRFGVAVQDLSLNLPRVFENRRFEVISFSHPEIGSVFELRGEGFYGFYLTHISLQRIDFVYACGGTHIEWGADKCVLQPSVTAEPVEFKGGALLGMAQTADHQFVFVVSPAYKRWVGPHETRCRKAFAHFLTVQEWAAATDRHTLIWPERMN